ncbi:MetQ/NlpA family ABC transporter substrate-binding protein [Halobacillus sp. BBL2006]|uniref:MetQ/NlpA family ABC transporter substrate-binding protein n=1 Tax=Halobacillus sp. BBL2006 TaxID=1543706 RepID=UPI000541F0DD|nr:MetQ/NlpA family ABC transporter substrate-binding protein [Halobacillus sp. BBL2006]KHE68677.1 methionine ABC transporter substrate-binding protein [Halobacillus sp. BBL2006]
MKKLWTAALALLFVLVLTACGSSEDDTSGSEESSGKESSEIKVGATSVPHAEVLEQAKPILKEEGITLKIEEYQDYILPNKDLAEGRIDANYFQTIPYLELQEEENGYDFVNLGGIHIEPIGVYSQKYDNIEDIEEGTTLVMSRSVSTHGRVLSLLEKEGLIKLDESVKKVDATVDDIVENPKNLEFDTGVDAANLPEVYKREENVLAAINTNYAIEAGLVPKEDAIILEGTDSPYVNVVAAQSKDKDSEALNKLVEVLRSEEIQSFIKEEYDGAVVPVEGASE